MSAPTTPRQKVIERRIKELSIGKRPHLLLASYKQHGTTPDIVRSPMQAPCVWERVTAAKTAADCCLDSGSPAEGGSPDWEAAAAGGIPEEEEEEEEGFPEEMSPEKSAFENGEEPKEEEMPGQVQRRYRRRYNVHPAGWRWGPLHPAVAAGA